MRRFILTAHLIIGLSAVCVMPSAGAASSGAKLLSRYIPGTCDVANTQIAIETMNFDDEYNGIRPPAMREFDFDKTGVLFIGIKFTAFAEYYADIEKIQYLKEKDHERGVLVVVVNFRDGQEPEELGYVQTACWRALTEFFKNYMINVKLDVKEAKE